jgi:hypothetical protein
MRQLHTPSAALLAKLDELLPLFDALSPKQECSDHASGCSQAAYDSENLRPPPPQRFDKSIHRCIYRRESRITALGSEMRTNSFSRKRPSLQTPGSYGYSMKVTITQLASSVEVKNTPVEFKVADPKGKHFGNFYADKVRVEWCGGGTRQKKTGGAGVQLTWKELSALLKSEDAKKAAIAAAKKV